jgi:hypothetical protein
VTWEKRSIQKYQGSKPGSEDLDHNSLCSHQELGPVMSQAYATMRPRCCQDKHKCSRFSLLLEVRALCLYSTSAVMQCFLGEDGWDEPAMHLLRKLRTYCAVFCENPFLLTGWRACSPNLNGCLSSVFCTSAPSLKIRLTPHIPVHHTCKGRSMHTVPFACRNQE